MSTLIPILSAARVRKSWDGRLGFDARDVRRAAVLTRNDEIASSSTQKISAVMKSLGAVRIGNGTQGRRYYFMPERLRELGVIE